MSMVYFFLQQLLLFSTPLLVAGLGGMFCERGGIINIGIEGDMIFGAFCGAMVMHFGVFGLSGQAMFLFGMLIAALAGMGYAALHGFASINLNANQPVSGIALNMAAPAIAIFIARLVIGRQQISYEGYFRIESIPFLSKIPILGPIFFQKVYISVYIAVAILIFAIILINRTRIGMRIRACGEYPQAAEAVGVNVYRVRYTGVLICGLMGGAAGLMLVVPTATEFNATVFGYGFLAVSVLILGRWRPRGILFAALFFGCMKTIASVYSAIPFLLNLNLDAFVFRMLPFVVTLVVMVISANRSQGPAAAGQPYDKGMR